MVLKCIAWCGRSHHQKMFIFKNWALSLLNCFVYTFMERVAVTANCGSSKEKVGFLGAALWHCWLGGGHSQIVKGSLLASANLYANDETRCAKKRRLPTDWAETELRRRIFLRLFKRQMTFVYCHSSYARKRLYHSLWMTKTNFLSL